MFDTIDCNCSICLEQKKCIKCNKCNTKYCKECVIENGNCNNTYGLCPNCKTKFSRMDCYYIYDGKVIPMLAKQLSKYREKLIASPLFNMRELIEKYNGTTDNFGNNEILLEILLSISKSSGELDNEIKQDIVFPTLINESKDYEKLLDVIQVLTRLASKNSDFGNYVIETNRKYNCPVIGIVNREDESNKLNIGYLRGDLLPHNQTFKIYTDKNHKTYSEYRFTFSPVKLNTTFENHNNRNITEMINDFFDYASITDVTHSHVLDNRDELKYSFTNLYVFSGYEFKRMFDEKSQNTVRNKVLSKLCKVYRENLENEKIFPTDEFLTGTAVAVGNSIAIEFKDHDIPRPSDIYYLINISVERNDYADLPVLVYPDDVSTEWTTIWKYYLDIIGEAIMLCDYKCDKELLAILVSAVEENKVLREQCLFQYINELQSEKIDLDRLNKIMRRYIIASGYNDFNRDFRIIKNCVSDLLFSEYKVEAENLIKNITFDGLNISIKDFGIFEKNNYIPVEGIYCDCGGNIISRKENDMVKYYCAKCNKIFEKLPEKQISSEDEKLISETCKHCPVCNVLIEKSTGCNHMFCPHCHNGFNWNDLSLLNDNNNTNPLFNELRHNQHSNLTSLLEEYNMPTASRNSRPIDYFGNKLYQETKESKTKITELKCDMTKDINKFLSDDIFGYDMINKINIEKMKIKITQNIFDKFIAEVFTIDEKNYRNLLKAQKKMVSQYSRNFKQIMTFTNCLSRNIGKEIKLCWNKKTKRTKKNNIPENLLLDEMKNEIIMFNKFDSYRRKNGVHNNNFRLEIPRRNNTYTENNRMLETSDELLMTSDEELNLD